MANRGFNCVIAWLPEGDRMFGGMGPITSKSLSGWQRTGDDAPGTRGLLVGYGLFAVFSGVVLFLWLR